MHTNVQAYNIPGPLSLSIWTLFLRYSYKSIHRLIEDLVTQMKSLEEQAKTIRYCQQPANDSSGLLSDLGPHSPEHAVHTVETSAWLLWYNLEIWVDR